MTVVESWVCSHPKSGTNQSVLLEFKSMKLETNESFTCRTNILKPRRWEWDRSSSGIWRADHNFLGNCTDFRPYDELKVKVIIERPQHTFDHLEICLLVATFGKNNEEGSSRWRSTFADSKQPSATQPSPS